MILSLDSDLTNVKGIGEKKAQLFSKWNIHTVRDLLFYFPRTYENYDEPVCSAAEVYAAGQSACAVLVTLVGRPSLFRGRGLCIVNAKFVTPRGEHIQAKWFHMPYILHQLKTGQTYILRGPIVFHGNGSVSMQQPSVISREEYQKRMEHMQPVYTVHMGASISIQSLRKYIAAIFDTPGFVIPESLSPDILQKYQLMDLHHAVRTIHFPVKKEELIEARRRIVFEEFYTFIVRVNEMKQAPEQKGKNHFAITYSMEVEQLAGRLPFRLTDAQTMAVTEICRDLTGDGIMNRLVQGDVGSGKTIVAFLTMYLVALNHYQSALMAPTEVLAVQHYESLCSLKETYDLTINPVLLTGSMTAKQKKEVYALIESGEADIIIGTHALIQEKVQFHSLAYVITDEQHRFGVRQRDILRGKGLSPHVLVMSATPIPRTLAMILYADLDITVIDELPKNRKPIKTCVISQNQRKNAYSFIDKEVAAGHQAYVICPMIDESEIMDSTNVMEYTSRLRQIYEKQNYRIEMLHGRMKQEEKNQIMTRFAGHEIDILVSTTVIEVGIDVGNATVIMIENANSFGLAQLHQLRGRVGRSELQSYCILVNHSSSEDSKKRLDILNHSNDGFYIASEDLKLRGPGDFFGVRQSGELLFQMADIYTDQNILLSAAEAASLQL